MYYLLCVCFQYFQVDKAFDLFTEMREKGMKRLSYFSFNTLVCLFLPLSPLNLRVYCHPGHVTLTFVLATPPT